jgi:acyl-CoA-dependent ceramide synthase
LALIGLSYRFHFTYMGIAVYITHDISDFFLAVCLQVCSLIERALTISYRRPRKPSTISTPSSLYHTLAPSLLCGSTAATYST